MRPPGSGYVLLTIEFKHEPEGWSALCRELGTTACAATLEEAREAIIELVELHVNTLEEVGERDAFFRRHKIEFHRQRPSHCERRVEIGRLVECITERVPLARAAAQV